MLSSTRDATFLTGFQGCHCCWSVDHPLNNKDLEKQGKLFRNRGYHLPFFCELATYFLTCGLYFSHHLFSAYSVTYTMPGSMWKLKRERKREREKELKLLKFCGKKNITSTTSFSGWSKKRARLETKSPGAVFLTSQGKEK